MPETGQPSSQNITSASGGINVATDRLNVTDDLVAGSKFVGYIAEQVNGLIEQIKQGFQPNPFDGWCPYLGLDAFTEDEADRFFWRERLINDLLERVKSSRFMLIAGPSGSSKSSLARA